MISRLSPPEIFKFQLIPFLSAHSSRCTLFKCQEKKKRKKSQCRNSTHAIKTKDFIYISCTGSLSSAGCQLKPQKNLSRDTHKNLWRHSYFTNYHLRFHTNRSTPVILLLGHAVCVQWAIVPLAGDLKKIKNK